MTAETLPIGSCREIIAASEVLASTVIVALKILLEKLVIFTGFWSAEMLAYGIPIKLKS